MSLISLRESVIAFGRVISMNVVPSTFSYNSIQSTLDALVIVRSRINPSHSIRTDN